jgi:ribosomal protein L36
MAIGNAVQRGSIVYVFNEKNSQIFSVSAGSKPTDGLTGYTSGTVNVRRGGLVYTYNEKGQQIGSQSIR